MILGILKKRYTKEEKGMDISYYIDKVVYVIIAVAFIYILDIIWNKLSKYYEVLMFINTCKHMYSQFWMSPKEKGIEDLKNALLTLALVKTRKQDEDKELLTFYSKFDGTTYPMLCGSSLSNACFTYMSDPFMMPAIQKYIDKNLGSYDQVHAFFKEYTKDIEEKNTDVTHSQYEEINKLLNEWEVDMYAKNPHLAIIPIQRKEEMNAVITKQVLDKQK